MPTRSKRSGLSDKVAGPRSPNRELCQDEDGNRYTVLVYRTFPNLSITYYTLVDGTPVRFIDDCLFEIESTGRALTRCP